MSLDGLREIRVYVRDAGGLPLNGVRVRYTENGEDRGGADDVEGQTTLTAVDPQSNVVVTVEYAGHSQNRKLAVEAEECVFVFDRTPPPLPPAAGPAPDSGGRWIDAMRNPKVLAAALGMVGIVVAAYLQFRPPRTPVSTPPSPSILTVFVKAAPGGLPLANAQVVLQDSSGRDARVTDHQGTARFELPSAAQQHEATVNASADGHVGQSHNVLVPRREALEIRLDARTAERPRPITGSAPAPTARIPPAGTWEVQVNADPNARRIASGRLVFDPQPDQSILVAGSFMLDGAPTSVDGVATMQSQRVLMKLSCRSPSHQWSCAGSLERSSPQRLRGSLVDMDNKAIPVELRGL